MAKKEYLIKELERLRKQQGELLRKKRREKDGHKDPLLQEINRLQDEVMAQISSLRKEHEAAERKRSEIEKVAQILGLGPADRPGGPGGPPRARDQEDRPAQSESRDQGRNPEERPAAGSSSKATSAKASPERRLSSAEAPPPDPFEYYDAGNHWCKNCNITSGSMFDFFTHLHSKPHRKTLDPYDRPWASRPTKAPKSTAGDAKLTKPAKGSEFLVPVRGFFCLLCQEFYGDAICAEEHVVTHAHNEKYKKQTMENPLYEQRRNLDRQAGLSLEAGGKKRKHDDEDKDDKSKNKKDKKKEEEAGDEKVKVKKEEEGKAARKSLEEDKMYSKKEEDERHKQSRKEDKHNSRENEERSGRHRGGGRDEEHRHRQRRSDDDAQPKYGSKAAEDKHKPDRSSDSRSKHDRDEAKHKAEPEKPAGKPDGRRSEPPKPYELPKIFCGPSPAMRAKLRKQAQEAGRAAPPAGGAAPFGKFTWKKKENQLAKEAQKVAAEFLKDEEAAAQGRRGEEDDSFSRSVAAAREIAEKLAGDELKAPWRFYPSGRGQIRPNLRAPLAPLRRAALAGKPAPLSAFLNMRPPGSDGGPAGPLPRAPFRPPNPVLFNNSPAAPPAAASREQFGPQLPPAMLKPQSSSDSAESKPEEEPLFQSRPAPVQSRPAAGQAGPSTASPAPSSETCSAPAAPPSQPALVEVVSDVAAPGVPESEQTRTVFVQPPPFKSLLGPQRPEKLQGNLAAAKAQALFDIFYSSLGQAGPSSFCRTGTDAKGPRSSQSLSQSQPRAQSLSQSQPRAPTQQTDPEPQVGPQLPNEPEPPKPQQSPGSAPPDPQEEPPPPVAPQRLSPPPTASTTPASPHNGLQSPAAPQADGDIQITSVWSLQDVPAAGSGPSDPPGQSPPAGPGPQARPDSGEPAAEPPLQPEPRFGPPTSPEPQPKPKPSPRTRGKAAAMKKSPSSGPVRQTRSQTRYQTRQQQSHPEPDLDPDAASDRETEPPGSEVAPETLGLPPNMAALDFDYTFNFE